MGIVDMSVDSLYADKQKLAPSDFIPAMGTYPVGCSGLCFFFFFVDIEILEYGYFGGCG